MALECFIGPERNLLETTAKHAARLRVENPILNNDQLLRLKSLDGKSACSWDSKTLSKVMPTSGRPVLGSHCTSASVRYSPVSSARRCR